jgi:transposase
MDMVNRRVNMRKIREVLRLSTAGHSRRAIAKSLGISPAAVADYQIRAQVAGLQWPLPTSLDDASLEGALFPAKARQPTQRRAVPDWAVVQMELKKKGATLQGLHAEYLAIHPDGMSYSYFCECYREHTATLKRYMRRVYTAGERVCVDYAGPTIKVYLPGESVRTAQIFAGVLPATSYTYCEATWTQRLPDWLAAHERMFEHFGGVPSVIVCDNLKSGVTKASRTEPVINATFQHFASHYGTMVVPARPLEPGDKAPVENGVLIIERWIMFRLRKEVFTSLADLNAAIRALCSELNARPFQKMPGSRQSTFDAIERATLMPLPATRYQYTEFRKVRIGLDGCINGVDSCPYSVPWSLVRKEVELRITADSIEILHGGTRMASHARSAGTKPVIDPMHLDPQSRHFHSWNAGCELDWALSQGPNTHAFLQILLSEARAKEQGYRFSKGLKAIEKDYGSERLDAACRRAIEIGGHHLESLRSILRKGLDQRPVSAITDDDEDNVKHANERDPKTYH